MAISKSPDRFTFQFKKYHDRLSVNPNDEEAVSMLEMQKMFQGEALTNEKDEKWITNNLEYDLRTTDWILEKTRTNSVYAQNLYSALCNNDFIKNEMWPLIKGDTWSCSWRHAGGIIADMLQRGDYIDWYCSGIANHEDTLSGYVPEGSVTEEIREDLFKLGWRIITDEV